MLRSSTEKEKNTTKSHDIIDDDNVYMNESISIGIPIEKLDTTVLKQGTKEYNDFKKEYAVSFFFYFFFYNYYYIFLIQIHI